MLRLIGHYQAGRDPSPELALRPGPLPKFDGGSASGMSPTVQPPPGPPPSAIQPQASGSGPIRVPPLTPDKAGQYAALFEKSGAQNGILPGEQAKQIFERAGLPNEILGRIWMLSDTEQKGSLHATEFVIAMHLLASFKAGALRALPNMLPAGLYEAAARRPPSRQSSGPGAMSAIPRQFSGASNPRAGSPLGRSTFAPPQQFPQPTGSNNDWIITPGDKAKFDGIYNNLDRSNRGFITGDEAVPFFSESKLPEEALAQIWDLADINSAGVLTRDEFAVAMYLIRQQRGKRDGRDALPATLPANLIPPSMRNQGRPNPAPSAPAFDNPAPTLPKSAAEDLFGLDALSTPVLPVQAPQSTGGSNSFGGSRQVDNDPFGSKSAIAPASPNRSSPQQSGIFKPFAPSSSFGQQLTYHATGNSSNSGPQQARSIQQNHSASDDLLGDPDPEFNNKIASDASELGNLSNQVGSLSKQMQDVQGQRAVSSNELSQVNSQKQQFEQRLAQLRTLYEQEVKDVKSLEERLSVSRNDNKKLQTEIAMLEGTYQDLQNQNRQTVSALQADQLENSGLKERMRGINAEIAQLKPALEKLRSDARQQKGLVAINKKQLATIESEREKLKAEAEELNKSIEEDTKALALAAASKSQSPAPVVSPAASTMSATNPFFRRQGSSADFTNSPFASPVATQQPDRSFENVFGPSFGTAAASNEAVPQPALKQDVDRRLSGGSNAPVRPQLGSGFPSPSASSAISTRELPSGHIPPPPPESRQISSSFLPFLEHTDSVSSSRQVSAPNSRFGDDGSTGADTPTNYMGMTPTGSSSAGQAENTRAISPGLERRADGFPSAIEHKESIPGAFPGDSVVATPTGGSTLSEQAAADPFAKAPERSGTAKSDFDSAFAGFGTSAKTQERSNTGNSSTEGSSAPAPTGVHKEFPPIAEIEDDDSDSASENGGFDDDFAPSSPGHARKISSPQVPTTSQAPPSADFLSARPAIAQNPSMNSLNTTNPPTPNDQVSPPTYDKVVSPTDQAQSEAKIYENLLPKREIPTSPTTSSPEQASSSLPAPVVKSQPVPPAKVPFDDDFDEFDDLEDAKEGDADDDFANISVHDRSGLDDFNPMFDSPPVHKNAPTSSQSNTAFGDDSVFGEFSQNAQPSQSPTNVVNDNNDWDAIFAGLDEAPPTNNASHPAVPESSTNGAAANLAPKDRPVIGRALTEAGVHDDPILKNLTGMGYARDDALKALEKYDYNLERVSPSKSKSQTIQVICANCACDQAANFLASQS